MNILVYHIGSLGDTLMAVPALRVIRENFPCAHITMLTDRKLGRSLVQVCDVLDGSGLIDDYIEYPTGSYPALIRLLFQLRSQRFESLVYLIRVYLNDRRIKRDLFFFRLAGIQKVAGVQGLPVLPEYSAVIPLPGVPRVADTLLKRLAASGLRVPPDGSGNMDLGISVIEANNVENWLAGLPSCGERLWVGVGIGGKMAVNRWPLERYERLIAALIEEYNVWPVVFGGPENAADGQYLVKQWSRGYAACGALGVREAISAISRCAVFVGNDTGTMHMAAMAGVSCVGVYSSRNFPGLWDPCGSSNLVLRTPISCEGCLLEECIENNMACILLISVQQVFEACRNVLNRQRVTGKTGSG